MIKLGETGKRWYMREEGKGNMNEIGELMIKYASKLSKRWITEEGEKEKV